MLLFGVSSSRRGPCLHDLRGKVRSRVLTLTRRCCSRLLGLQAAKIRIFTASSEPSWVPQALSRRSLPLLLPRHDLTPSSLCFLLSAFAAAAGTRSTSSLVLRLRTTAASALHIRYCRHISPRSSTEGPTSHARTSSKCTRPIPCFQFPPPPMPSSPARLRPLNFLHYFPACFFLFVNTSLVL